MFEVDRNAPDRPVLVEAALIDDRMSCAALGAYVRLCALAEGGAVSWTSAAVVARPGDDEAVLRRALAELRDAGWVDWVKTDNGWRVDVKGEPGIDRAEVAQ